MSKGAGEVIGATAKEDGASSEVVKMFWGMGLLLM